MEHPQTRLNEVVGTLLVVRLSNVADLRLLLLTPLLHTPLVEVEEHCDALLWWSEPATAEAVVQHVIRECRQARTPWSHLPSFAPALGLVLGQCLFKLSPESCAASQVCGKLARRFGCLSTWGPFPCGTSFRDHVPKHVWDPPESVPTALPAVEELDDTHEAAFLKDSMIMSTQSSSGHSKSCENRRIP